MPRSQGSAASPGRQGPFESPQQQAYLLLCRTVSELGRPLERMLGRYGLSQATYQVLRIVREHDPKGLPSQAIGPLMIARGPDVTRLVDRLCRLGLVSRVRCHEDRRVMYVRATVRGRACLARLDPKVRAIHRAQFAGVSGRDVDKLIRLLGRVRRRSRSAQPRKPHEA